MIMPRACCWAVAALATLLLGALSPEAASVELPASTATLTGVATGPLVIYVAPEGSPGTSMLVATDDSNGNERLVVASLVTGEEIDDESTGSPLGGGLTVVYNISGTGIDVLLGVDDDENVRAFSIETELEAPSEAAASLITMATAPGAAEPGASIDEITGGKLTSGIEGSNAICTYESKATGELFAFIVSKHGDIAKHLVAFNPKTEMVETYVISKTSVPDAVFEACLADSDSSVLYLGGANNAGIGSLWTADPEAAPLAPELLTTYGEGNEVKGLGLWRASPSDAGYLVASSEGNNQLTVHDLAAADKPIIRSVSFAGAEDLGTMSLAIGAQLGAGGGGLVAVELETAAGEQYSVYSWQDIAAGLLSSLDSTDSSRRAACADGECGSPPTCPEANNCNGQGRCTGDAADPCLCFSGWLGGDFYCSVPTCDQVADCSSDLGRGECTGPNTCTCGPEYGGKDCGFLALKPVLETQASGVDADDPAIWVHPTDGSLSAVIGTVKDGKTGLHVFDVVTGVELDFKPTLEVNSVDVLYGFEMADGTVLDLVITGDRGVEPGRLLVYSFDGENRTIGEVGPAERADGSAASQVQTGLEMYGSCTYRSPVTGKFYAAANSKDAEFEMYELYEEAGTINGKLVRSFIIGNGTQVEGCVFDDELAELYIGEELAGVWKYGAEPEASNTPVEVDRRRSKGGNIDPDVEGMSLVVTGPGTGYLLVSSQEQSAYAVYTREAPNTYLATLTFTGTPALGIDRVSETDGLKAISTALGPLFPEGAVIVHDDKNNLPDGSASEQTTFKAVSWKEVASHPGLQKPLATCPTWDPRRSTEPQECDGDGTGVAVPAAETLLDSSAHLSGAAVAQLLLMAALVAVGALLLPAAA